MSRTAEVLRAEAARLRGYAADHQAKADAMGMPNGLPYAMNAQGDRQEATRLESEAEVLEQAKADAIDEAVNQAVDAILRLARTMEMDVKDAAELVIEAASIEGQVM